MLRGFILHSLATEEELRKTLEPEPIDTFTFKPVENKFEFVHAVEKKIVKIQSTDEITGEALKHYLVPWAQYILEAQMIWQPF